MPSEFDRLQAALPKRYTLLREIDRGGMSRVYLAREALPERDVAIKVLDPVLSAQLGRERFLREVELTSQLGHPHIVPIYAAGEADGELYYVMPFIAGESLRDRLEREGRLPIDDALQITMQVADALAHAHVKGIVHRDVKPANVLFQSGHAVVADFGIARALRAAEDGGTLTRAGTSLGTPDYMSPEQIGGGAEIGPPTDIYALACVLYEMLGGQPPFHSRTAQATLARHLTDAMPSLRALRDSVPPEVEDTIRKALAKVPGERHKSVVEFANALRSSAPGGSYGPALNVRERHPIGPLGRSLRVAGVLVAAAAIGFAWNAWSGGAPAIAEIEDSYRDSVAIMPFENLTGDESLDLVGRSIADAVINHLHQVPNIRVPGLYSVASLYADSLGHPVLLDSLNVGHLLEGSLVRRNGGIGITVSEIDARGNVVFSYPYEPLPREALDGEIAAISHDIAAAFLDRHQLGSVNDAREGGYGPGLEAYLLGTESAGQRTRDGLADAVRMLRQSVELDPGFAQAHAALSYTYSLSLAYRYDIGEDAYDMAAQALAAADEAISLEPDLADGYASRGYARVVLGIEIDEALQDFQRAGTIATNEPNQLSWSSRVLALNGVPNEALAAARRAQEIDPLQSGRHIAVAALAFQTGDYEEALAAARAARGLEPQLMRAWAFEARALALSGRPEDCLRLDLGPYDIIHATCHRAAGRMAEADALIAAAEADLRSGIRRNPEYLDDLAAAELAAYRAFAGDPDGAATWAEVAFDRSPVGVDPRIYGSALFAPVRDDPGFRTAFEAARRRAGDQVLAERQRLNDGNRPRLRPRE